MKLLIQNGRVLDPVSKTVTLTDLLAENGRVALLERGLETEADRIIDASGLVVSPGLVDMHVHLRDPGYTYKEDIRTGTAAAARGGVTSLACMANTDPVLDCPEQLHYVRERAKEGSGVHVYPIAAVSVGLRGEEPTDAEALKKAGAVALSDDGCNVDNANLMRDAMIRAKRQELPVLCHCEDTSMVEGRAVNEGSVSHQLWLEGRPAIAEELDQSPPADTAGCEGDHRRPAGRHHRRHRHRPRPPLRRGEGQAPHPGAQRHGRAGDLPGSHPDRPVSHRKDGADGDRPPDDGEPRLYPGAVEGTAGSGK